MANPTFLQTKTAASDASAGTTHTITLDSAVATVGGLTSPSCLILQASYDGNSAGLISSITDTLGNTWQRCTDGTTALSFSNGAGVNGEMWYCLALVGGGSAPTITVTTSSSVKVKLAVGEINGVRPVSSVDRTLGRIHTPSVASTSRLAGDLTGGGAYSTKRRGMIEVIVAGTAWNDTRTASNGSNFTGTVYLQGGSSNLGVGLARSSVDRQTLHQQYSVGRFTMSASDTQPNAVMACTFYRDGVVTATDEDGTIQNIEGAETIDTGAGAVHTFWGGNGLYRSSSSAPLGGTGASETDHVYSFFPDYSANLLTGVTIGSTVSWVIGCNTGNDDASGYVTFQGNVYKNGELGDTMTSADENVATNLVFNNDLSLTVAGFHTFTFDKATYYNPSGTTATKITAEGDTMSMSSNTWATIYDYKDNAPQYLVLELHYPYKKTFSESISLTQAFINGARKILSDAASLVEAFTKVFTPGSTAYTKTLTEVVTISDTILRAMVRTLGETVTMVDAFIRGRILTDAINVTEDFFAKIRSRILADAITLSEETKLPFGIIKVFWENVELETFDRFTKTITRSWQETVSAVETVSRTTARTLADAVDVTTDTITTLVSRFITLAESLTVTATITRSIARIWQEGVTLYDSAIRGFARVYSDSVAFGEVFIRGRIFTDSLSVSDTFSRTVQFLRVLFNMIVQDDEVARSVSTTKADTMTLADVATKGFGRLFSDGVTLADSYLRGIGKGLLDILRPVVSFKKRINGILADLWVHQPKDSRGEDWRKRPKDL